MLINTVGQTYNFTTLAGNQISGSADGSGPAARFYAPYGVATDGNSDVFVADTFNYTIRKITPDGEVTTVAGLAGIRGSADGNGKDARFSGTSGLVVGQQGVIYVSDTGNRTIRRIDSDGMVTTLAGKVGITMRVDGTGSEARFGGPWGITLDNTGNLIVADKGSYTLRKVTTNGIVTTLTDSSGNIAKFDDPTGVAVDSIGNIFVADGGGHTIQKVTPEGAISTFAGVFRIVGNRDGVGSNAFFGTLDSIAIDRANNLFVADLSYSTIRKITPDAVVTTIAGSSTGINGYEDGVGPEARFNGPIGVAVDRFGNLYIADQGNNMIRKGTPILPLQIAKGGGTGNQLSASWPTWAVNYVLESAPTIGGTNTWSLVTDTTNISTNTTNFVYTFSPTGPGRHFRVRSQ